MPYKSKPQMRAFFAMEERGELPPGTAERWAHETPNLKKLPERVGKKRRRRKRRREAEMASAAIRKAAGGDRRG